MSEEHFGQLLMLERRVSQVFRAHCPFYCAAPLGCVFLWELYSGPPLLIFYFCAHKICCRLPHIILIHLAWRSRTPIPSFTFKALPKGCHKFPILSSPHLKLKNKQMTVLWQDSSRILAILQFLHHPTCPSMDYCQNPSGNEILCF